MADEELVLLLHHFHQRMFTFEGGWEGRGREGGREGREGGRERREGGREGEEGEEGEEGGREGRERDVGGEGWGDTTKEEGNEHALRTNDIMNALRFN